MDVADFDFELPEALIAQEPLAERDACRLLRLGKADGAVSHHTFRDVLELLPARCLLILNETRVIPARFGGRRASGGKVELLLSRPLAGGDWEALVKAGGTLRPPDEVLTLEDGAARVRLVAKVGPGRYRVAFEGEDAVAAAERCGHMPLPPYVKRDDTPADRETYQTVFARVPGAVAAPTAGLHFTPELLAAAEAKGIEIARVLLHVGLGTFMPIRVDTVEDHVMEAECYAVPAAAREAIARAQAEGRQVVACGTTAVRALETWSATGEPEGESELFLYPGKAFGVVDGLITNFHLPRSTLLMLVSALAVRERVLAAYRQAVAAGYRFYSYGDAMLIV